MSSGDRLRDGRADGGERFSLGDPDFASYLRVLKRHGCNLLVTGEAGPDAFAAMTRELLGATDEHRVRVLALTDATCADAASLLPDGVGVDDPGVRVLRHDSSTRDVEIESPVLDATPPQTDIGRFQDEICETIEGFDADRSLTPAELRLGVVSLCPLVDADETDAVVEFVRTVGASVLRTRAMAHYQLPVADDAPIVEELALEFDARIEVRNGSSRPPEHRWHVPEYDLTTPWVEI